MKKCPECGNASYDGAPVCGNCGYKFSKSAIPKRKSIFQDSRKDKKLKAKPKIKAKVKPKSEIKKKTKPKTSSNDDDVITILKDNKLLIGAILLITVIAISAIVLTSNGNTPPQKNSDVKQYSEAGFSFNYPTTWKQINGTDIDHPSSVYFESPDGEIVQYYNVSSDYTSLKEVTKDRITNALNDGSYVDTIQTITVDSRNAADTIFESSSGDYTRYISILSDGTLHVFKIYGDSINTVNSNEITKILDSTHIH